MPEKNIVILISMNNLISAHVRASQQRLQRGEPEPGAGAVQRHAGLADKGKTRQT